MPEGSQQFCCSVLLFGSTQRIFIWCHPHGSHIHPTLGTRVWLIPPPAPEVPIPSCRLSLLQGRACPFHAPWLGQEGTPSRETGPEVSPLWQPAWLAATTPSFQAPETWGEYTSIHNCGPGSTSAECILQPDTPQTPPVPMLWYCQPPGGIPFIVPRPFATIGLLLAWAALWGDLEALEFPTDYGTLKHPPQDGSRVLDQVAELKRDTKKVWLTMALLKEARVVRTTIKQNSEKKNFLETLFYSCSCLQFYDKHLPYNWDIVHRNNLHGVVWPVSLFRVTLIKNRRKSNYKVLWAHEVSISYFLI